jgi:hypothetical protein
MKKLIISILLLLAKSGSMVACGYSPYGEDIRYSLFLPEYFDYPEYQPFHYTCNLWGYNATDDIAITYYSDNIYDWYQYTHKETSLNDIYIFNEQLKFSDINENSPNTFIKYLYKKNKINVIQYLKLAKKCEDYNAYINEDCWERNTRLVVNDVSIFFQEIQKAYENEKEYSIKRKYAFQIIRLAYYHKRYDILKRTFEEAFLHMSKDYLYYWSLYFYCFTKNENGNYNEIAEVFANCKDKAYATQLYFSYDFDINEAIKFAQNEADTANIYAYKATRNIGKALDDLKQIYWHKKKCRILDFLLLREINKIEDWVYTPYYTYYEPSIVSPQYNNPYIISTESSLLERSAKDRLYAKEVLDFINKTDGSKVDNKILWEAAKIQLLFITKDYHTAISHVDIFEKKYKNAKILRQLKQIKALCYIAMQKEGKTIITKEVQEIILENFDNKRFLFALGRELEYKKNLLDGIALISLHNNRNRTFDYLQSQDVEWRGNRLANSTNLDYFYYYFDYLDFVYSAKDLSTILTLLDEKKLDDFHVKLYAQLLSDKRYLTDLLGTKYVREENLVMAYKIFKSLGDDYWDENYNAWERDLYDGRMEFDANPFYTIKYTPEFIEHKDKYFVNKLSITQHLIAYLSKAQNSQEKNRAYYYFLVGNCYLNMSDMGNSWMMRRFQSISEYDYAYLHQSYIDNLEYRTRNKTIYYYEMAYKYATSPKFKALCLHMIYFANCNKSKNERLQAEFPDYYDDFSSCNNLKDYFVYN